MACNIHGNANENNLVEALNNKSFDDLNDNLKSFIKSLNPNIKNNDIISASKLAGHYKSDLKIKVKDNTYNISVKMGSNNSVHQEKIESFIDFLKNQYNISDDLANDLKFFIWGDGTLDGSAPISDRMNVSTIKKNYPELINNIKLALSKYKTDLIDRFVFTGIYNDSIDYIYHGDPNYGIWASQKEIFPYILESNSNNSLSVGMLTFQAWNRSLEGKNDHKRGQIQLKCSSLSNVLNTIMNERGNIKND